jgi:hypothetical protein
LRTRRQRHSSGQKTHNKTLQPSSRARQ